MLKQFYVFNYKCDKNWQIKHYIPYVTKKKNTWTTLGSQEKN